MEFHKFSSSTLGTYSLSNYPESCPECHHRIVPILISHKYLKQKGKLYAFLNCPNPNCEISFVGEYLLRSGFTILDFNRIIVGTVVSENFSSQIVELSPMFTKIYNQSYYAEQNQLFEICGVGYRKALEFLIKDYLIYKNPENESDIKKLLLGKCISDFVEDNRIKETAKRAVWLGNDHTHYIKKWEGKDLNDLKLLIKLSVNWIESELMTEQFVSDMS